MPSIVVNSTDMHVHAVISQKGLAVGPTRLRTGEWITELEQFGRTEKVLDSALPWSAVHYHAVIDAASWAIIIASSDGLIEFFNRAAEHIFGYREDEVIGRPMTLIIPDRLRAAHEAGLRRYRETRVPVIVGRTVRLIGLRRDGIEIEIELTVTAIDNNPNLLFIGLIREIGVRFSERG